MTYLSRLLLHAPSDASLAQRVKDFLTRQVAWFEKVLSELETLEQDLDEPELETLASQTARHAEGMARFEQELGELTREWEAASDVTESDRAEIGALAKRAEALVERLNAAHERAMGLIGERTNSVKQGLMEARRGRDLLRRYHTGDQTEAAFIDKKA